MASILEKIKGQTNLPSLAKNINLLMQSLTDNNLNYRQLAAIIKQHPEIATRLIFLANSPWAAPVRPISSIEQACSILGISIVKSITFGISIASSFDTRKCPAFNAEHFWTTSMLVAEGAGLLASKLSKKPELVEFEQTAQTAGILHNVGLLWLADNLPEETNMALEKVVAEQSLTVNDALLQCTGTDYCEVGGWIGDQLTLPNVLVVAIKHHLDSDYQESSWEIAQMVGSATKMVASLHNQSDKAPENARLEALGLDLSTQMYIFQQLSKKFEKTQELAKTLFTG